jgi:hypothetical protein
VNGRLWPFADDVVRRIPHRREAYLLQQRPMTLPSSGLSPDRILPIFSMFDSPTLQPHQN